MHRSRHVSRARAILVFLSISLFTVAYGCSDSVEVEDLGDPGPISFEGNLDPGAGTYILREFDTLPPEHAPIRLQLIGRNLEVDAENSSVSLDVAIRNLSEATLHPDVIVWLSEFHPGSVMPTNADFLPPGGGTAADSFETNLWGFGYSELLGDDGLLTPREISGFREWNFYDPDLAPFSFSATVEFSLRPPSAVLGGIGFNDADADGVLDPDESGFGGGVIFVDGPGRDATQVIELRPDGRYRFPVEETGLYSLKYIPPPTLAPFAPIIITTPNPLEVLMTPGLDGLPQDYLDANFGTHSPGFPIQIVEITERPPADIPTDPYRLGHAWLRNTILGLDVGFSGCSAGHPFRLYMAGGFAESNPVQATLVLTHDDLGELCDAYFEERRFFELQPIVQLYKEMYDGGEGIQLNLITPNGHHQFFLSF
jgi:hypothetical protein